MYAPNASLSRAQLGEANLELASLVGSNLGQADLRRAILVQANLQEAILRGANAAGADFTGAHLNNADLQHADLRGANLGGALGLVQAQLDAACLDEATIVPSDLRRPQACSEQHLRRRQ